MLNDDGGAWSAGPPIRGHPLGPRRAVSRPALLATQYPIAIITSEPQHRSIVERHIEVAVPSGHYFRNSIDLDDRRSMNSSKPRWIEPVLKLSHRHADDIALPVGVQVGVVRARLDPIDVGCLDEHDAFVVLDGKTGQITVTSSEFLRTAALARTPPLVEYFDETLVRFVVPGPSDFEPRTIEGGMKSTCGE